jgi:putative flippase GtrA
MFMVRQVLAAGRGLWADARLRYLAVGGVNTAFGYGVSLALYYGLRPYLHLIVISAIANVVCITFSFLNYKTLVFRTQGRWLREYFRCYLVYGAGMVVGTLLLWVMVDFLAMPFWLVQGLLLGCTVCLSYLGHSRYSFQQGEQK